MSCHIHEWILRSLTHPSKPIHLSNTTAALRAFIAARYFQQLENKNKKTALLVICPNEDNARTFCNDIESLSSLTGNKKINPYFFPTWERSPYSPITLSLQTRHLRLACLSQLIRKQFPFILVTTLPAAFQASFPKEHFEDLCIKIEVASSTWSRENLIQQLTHFGYLRVDPVEDPGTFAVRGDILDVFPPDSEQPFRIEIFGDEIEKIREFNPTTQRTSSEKTIHSLEIIPAREVLIHHNNSSILREKVKQRADDLGIPRIVRDPVISSIREGIYPEQSDSWAPFAYSNSATLWDLLPEDYSILWNDESDCQEEWKAFIAEQKKLEEQLSDRELIVPKVDELYSRNSDQDKIIQSHSKLFFDQIEWTDSKSLTDSETDSDTNVRLNVHSIPTLVKESRHSLSELTQWLKSFARKNYQITIFASTQTQLERIKFLLSEHAIDTASLSLGSLSQGFIWEEEKLLVLSESEILGSPHSRKLRKPSRTEAEAESAAQNWSDLQTLSDLGVGDGVVHIDHGIGKYQGLVRLELGGAASDFLLLEYANKDKLYLPVYRLNTIQKYVGSIQQVSLDRLGSQQFAKTKEKVKNAVKTLAIDLVQLYAERKIRPGVPFSPRGSELREFEAQFPFDETPDQLKAIDSIMNDLESGRVMDRLVCGDVGYGKTEVAIRAAFQAISNGKQVAVLVPTTLLAQQHELSFKERFKTYPIIIESISRFKTTREQKALLEATAQGKLDLLIGTHRLLSRDVQFQDLGLIIVDEEHRFGVEHKEKLKTLKTNTHVLTLTATPIPRTLHMALSGLRDISLMRTPPVNRLPIRTYVSRYDDELIQRGIEFELSRGGQVFFLHNRVQTIYKKAEQIRKLLPQAKVIVAHGQMPEGELENQMLTFYQKKANVLICTTIIEAGLDLPSANTLIVDRADTLGLAQLYQIRGRVGRSETRGYAYLLTPAESILTTEAKRRLEVIQRFVELGSGFNIASHDLEIRGGGDLLGPQQSGHIASVGFELYTELLEEAIREIQGKPLAPEQSRREPEIKTPFPSFLSESYVPDVHQRLSLYRRLSGTQKDSEIDQIEEELNDRFGALPTEAQNLVWIIRIKLLLKQMGMEGLTVGPEKISLLTGPLSQIDPVRGITLISSYPNRYQLTPDSKLVVKTATNSLRDLYFNIEQIFRDFCKS